MTGPDQTGIRFFKLEALGNDFVLIDARSTPLEPSPKDIVRLADRRTGIGFDQLLLLTPGVGSIFSNVEIFNADGSRAEQCGNGMRAIAAWLDRENELLHGTRLNTAAGPVNLARHALGGYTAVLPGPEPLTAEALGLESPFLGEDLANWTLVSLGNPHLIVDSPRRPSAEDLARMSGMLNGSAWRDRVNIGLMHVASDNTAILRVHERGAGPTRACGSGACAAAWALRRQRPSDAQVAVEQPGGTLVVDLASCPGRAVTTGPASVVFDGRIVFKGSIA